MLKFFLGSLMLTLAICANGQVPSLAWAKQIEGFANSHGTGIVEDNNGNVISVGYFGGVGGNDFDPGINLHLISATGTTDSYILKQSANGDFIWAKSIGGANNFVNVHALDINIQNEIVISGTMNGVIDFDPGPGIMNLGSPLVSAYFISKYDQDGNLIWAKLISSPMSGLGDVTTALVFDQNGSIYVTGNYSNNPDFERN